MKWETCRHKVKLRVMDCEDVAHGPKGDDVPTLPVPCGMDGVSVEEDDVSPLRPVRIQRGLAGAVRQLSVWDVERRVRTRPACSCRGRS